MFNFIKIFGTIFNTNIISYKYTILCPHDEEYYIIL